MGWGSRRWAKLAWAAVVTLGLAALPAIAATNAAEGGNEKSGLPNVASASASIVRNTMRRRARRCRSIPSWLRSWVRSAR